MLSTTGWDVPHNGMGVFLLFSPRVCDRFSLSLWYPKKSHSCLRLVLEMFFLLIPTGSFSGLFPRCSSSISPLRHLHLKSGFSECFWLAITAFKANHAKEMLAEEERIQRHRHASGIRKLVTVKLGELVSFFVWEAKNINHPSPKMFVLFGWRLIPKI